MVVPENSRIKFEDQKYKSVHSLESNLFKAKGTNLQNFAIYNNFIYISGNIYNGDPKKTQPIIYKYNTSNYNMVFNKKNNLVSHGQGFDVDSKGKILLLAANKKENGEAGKYNVRIYKNLSDTNPNLKDKTGEQTIDYDNDMIAIINKDKNNKEIMNCNIYEYSKWRDNKDVNALYSFSFKIKTTDCNNGYAIHNGYLYQITGGFTEEMHIIVRDFFGNEIKNNVINVQNPKTFFSDKEAEGIKIYDNHIYIGSKTLSKNYALERYNIGKLE